MVFNGIQWYSMVYHWHIFVRDVYVYLGKLFVTIDVKKKHVLVDKKRVYGQELINPRASKFTGDKR